MGLLLVNDHIFKVAAPSWLTGKLSDFAGLTFAPFLIALPLAWIIPASRPRVGQIACLLCGIGFALIKTVPAVRDAVVWLESGILGAPVQVWLDPSDLLTLPALCLSWYIWTRPANHNLSWALVALGFGALATVATSPAPYNSGIVCLKLTNNTLSAMTSRDPEQYFSVERTFTSSDGGHTWSNATNDGSTPCTRNSGSWELSDPAQPKLKYRFNPNQSIERSDDGGQSWRVDLDVSGLAAEGHSMRYKNAIYRTLLHSPYEGPSGPLDAVIDPKTGILYVAMGHSGIFARTPSDDWNVIGVDSYGMSIEYPPDPIPLELGADFWFMVLLVPLSAATVLPYNRKYARARLWMVVVAWICWLLSTMILVNSQDLSVVLLVITVPATAILSLLGLLIIGLNLPFRTRGVGEQAVLCATAAPFVYGLPLVLWGTKLIQSLTFARIAALVLLALFLYATYQSLRKKEFGAQT